MDFQNGLPVGCSHYKEEVQSIGFNFGDLVRTSTISFPPDHEFYCTRCMGVVLLCPDSGPVDKFKLLCRKCDSSLSRVQYHTCERDELTITDAKAKLVEKFPSDSKYFCFPCPRPRY